VGVSARQFPRLGRGWVVAKWYGQSAPGSFVKVVEPFGSLAPPESPELLWKEIQAAKLTDEEIHKVTWENACKFFNWDPFVQVAKESATVGALRAGASDVDTTRMSRGEWRARNEALGVGAP
jgi:hypothetical protein